MRILVTADIHFGYSNRLNDTITALNIIYKYAVDNNIEKIIILGDLFHNREYITIDVLNAVYDFFRETSKHVEWLVFPGNHDMFLKTSTHINSVRPLGSHITTIDNESYFSLDNRRFVVLPFNHFEEVYMAKLRYIIRDLGDDDILLTHIGVNNAVNNSCFLLKHWSVVDFTDVNVALVLAGHFHNYQVIDNKVCYPGSPIPFKFDEGMVPHGFLDIDIETLAVNFIDLKDVDESCDIPDFITVDDKRLEQLGDDGVKELCTNNRVRIILTREYSKSELDKLRGNVLDVGACDVKWMKRDDNHEIEATDKLEHNDFNKIFIKWLDTKKIANYDKDLMLDLHTKISEKVEELYVREEHE